MTKITVIDKSEDNGRYSVVKLGVNWVVVDFEIEMGSIPF